MEYLLWRNVLFLFLASPGGEQQKGLYGEPGDEVRVKTAGKDDKSDFSY